MHTPQASATGEVHSPGRRGLPAVPRRPAHGHRLRRRAGAGATV